MAEAPRGAIIIILFPLLPEHSPPRRRRTEASSCIVGVWVSEAEKVGGAPSLSSFVFLDTTGGGTEFVWRERNSVHDVVIFSEHAERVRVGFLDVYQYDHLVACVPDVDQWNN